MTTPQEHAAWTPANAEQAANWDGPAGAHRVSLAGRDDAEVRLHNERFRAAARIGPRERVLDIGCGTGQSTRDAARAAVAGNVLGVDLSVQMLDYARRVSAEDGLDNVAYEQADAQTHRFAVAHFDVAISRFGTMFFADPVAAFTNIGRALRPGARLVLMVWQDRAHNEWETAVQRALVPDRELPPSPDVGAHPFALADPVRVEQILHAAGFTAVGFDDVHEPVDYGPDAAAAFRFVRGFKSTTDALTALDDAAAERTVDRLRATLADHDTGHGVLFDSRAWIVTARRA